MILSSTNTLFDSSLMDESEKLTNTVAEMTQEMDSMTKKLTSAIDTIVSVQGAQQNIQDQITKNTTAQNQFNSKLTDQLKNLQNDLNNIKTDQNLQFKTLQDQLSKAFQPVNTISENNINTPTSNVITTSMNMESKDITTLKTQIDILQAKINYLMNPFSQTYTEIFSNNNFSTYAPGSFYKIGGLLFNFDNGKIKDLLFTDTFHHEYTGKLVNNKFIVRDQNALTWLQAPQFIDFPIDNLKISTAVFYTMNNNIQYPLLLLCINDHPFLIYSENFIMQINLDITKKTNILLSGENFTNSYQIETINQKEYLIATDSPKINNNSLITNGEIILSQTPQLVSIILTEFNTIITFNKDCTNISISLIENNQNSQLSTNVNNNS